jgi:hypothetical protein
MAGSMTIYSRKLDLLCLQCQRIDKNVSLWVSTNCIYKLLILLSYMKHVRSRIFKLFIIPVFFPLDGAINRVTRCKNNFMTMCCTCGEFASKQSSCTHLAFANFVADVFAHCNKKRVELVSTFK